MAFEPKPVVLTQIDAADYEGAGEPQPLVVVGDLPTEGVAVPAPPASGTVHLISTDGVLSWAAVSGGA